MSDPLLLTIDQAASTLHCKRTKVFELISLGVLIKAPKFGRRTTVYAESVFAALEKAYDPAPVVKKKRVRGSRSHMHAGFEALLAETRAR